MAAATAAVPSGGRATVRGAGGEPRPGADIAGAQRGMEGLSMGGAGRAGQTRRRGALLFISEPHTRPAHITDKRGEFVTTTYHSVLIYQSISASVNGTIVHSPLHESEVSGLCCLISQIAVRSEPSVSSGTHPRIQQTVPYVKPCLHVKF